MLVLLDQRNGGVIARDATVWERILTHTRSARLDAELAHGTRPEASALLALRAQALVRPAGRHDVARSVQRILAEADRPPAPPLRAAVPIRRDRVRAVAGDLRILIDHLLAPCPLAAAGVAQTLLLLHDGAGPLFYPGNTEDLHTRLQEIISALEPLNNW
jgi:hypothetical protein